MNTRRTMVWCAVAVLLIAAAAAVAVRGFSGSSCGAKATAARQLVKSGLNSAIERFQAHMGRWPRSLDELINKPADGAEASRWDGPYTSAHQLNDPFGVEWRYRSPGEHDPNGYDLSSAGVDRRWGTSDDLTNWDSAGGAGGAWMNAQTAIVCGLGVLMAAALVVASRAGRHK